MKQSAGRNQAPAFSAPAVPHPEPPRVVYTRALVPDASLTSEMGSCGMLSPELQHKFGCAPLTPNLTRYNVSHPSLMPTSTRPSPTASPGRQPLRPIQRPASAATPVHAATANRLSGPVIRHSSAGQQSAEVNRMCRLIERHDQQLQLISQQIETLLKLQQEKTSGQMPVKCNAETNTSRTWSSPEKECTPPPDQRIRQTTGSDKANTSRGILRSARTVTHKIKCTEQSIECGRFGEDEQDENDRYFYDNMLSDISDILSRSSDSDGSCASLRSPVKRCTTRKRVVQQVTHQRSPEKNAGSETIYINRLAAKYLLESRQPAVSTRDQHRTRRMRQQQPHAQVDQAHRHQRRAALGRNEDGTSIATRNYMQRYGLPFAAEPRHTTRPNNKLLDLQQLEQLPKFV